MILLLVWATFSNQFAKDVKVRRQTVVPPCVTGSSLPTCVRLSIALRRLTPAALLPSPSSTWPCSSSSRSCLLSSRLFLRSSGFWCGRIPRAPTSDPRARTHSIFECLTTAWEFVTRRAPPSRTPSRCRCASPRRRWRSASPSSPPCTGAARRRGSTRCRSSFTTRSKSSSVRSTHLRPRCASRGHTPCLSLCAQSRGQPPLISAPRRDA